MDRAGYEGYFITQTDVVLIIEVTNLTLFHRMITAAFKLSECEFNIYLKAMFPPVSDSGHIIYFNCSLDI